MANEAFVLLLARGRFALGIVDIKVNHKEQQDYNEAEENVANIDSSFVTPASTPKAPLQKPFFFSSCTAVMKAHAGQDSKSLIGRLGKYKGMNSSHQVAVPSHHGLQKAQQKGIPIIVPPTWMG